MKPLYISIKKSPEETYYVNSQDIKTVNITRDGICEVTTSVDLIRFAISSNQVDRLKREIRDRYRVITVKLTGVEEESRPWSRRRRRSDKNRVLFVTQDSGDLQIIWPRALKLATVVDGAIKLFTHIPTRGKSKARCEVVCSVKSHADCTNWLALIHGIAAETS